MLLNIKEVDDIFIRVFRGLAMTNLFGVWPWHVLTLTYIDLDLCVDIDRRLRGEQQHVEVGTVGTTDGEPKVGVRFWTCFSRNRAFHTFDFEKAVYLEEIWILLTLICQFLC